MTLKRLDMIHTTIQCLKCLATGRLATILKKKRLNGDGNCWGKDLGFRKTVYMQQYLREVQKIMYRAIMKLSLIGKNVSQNRKEEFLQDQKRITSGKWEKRVRVVPVRRSMLIYGMMKRERNYPEKIWSIKVILR